MSWMQKLYDTYNQCTGWVGKYSSEGKRPLAPVCHITINAHVEATLDEDGNIQSARPITNPNDMTTIVPATEDSASKTSGIAPHPLIDKLQYVAGDFISCGGKLPKAYQGEGGKKKDPKKIHEAYLEWLREWCNSEFSHPKAHAVLKYVEKGTLVKDLARYGVLYLGKDGKFLAKKEVKRNRDDQDIFAVPGVNDQQAAVVRWRVEIDDGTEMETWRDETLWQSWQNYYLNKKKAESRAFCYVTGEEAILTSKHPKYIRKKGDSPKLISSNDDKGFTFRGRFGTADEACLIGLETSQKAHNALVWLIDRQGKVFEEQGGKKKAPGLTILAWESSAKKNIPQPFQSSTEIGVYEDEPEEETGQPTVGQSFATRLSKKMMGYKANLKESKGISIIALDALSQGRMAVTYYQEFQPEIYLKNIERWHRECAWGHYYLRKYARKPFAPALLDIAEVIHGKKAGAKIKHHTVSRLLACVVEGRSLPRDIVDVAVRQASKRMGLHDPDDKKFRGDDDYTWRKALTIACALFRKYTFDSTRKEYSMSLDPTNTNRDYLYGRLLAIADHLESKALRDEQGKQKRPTNAARMMQQFSQRPYRTWKQIHDALPPYFWRLKSKIAAWYKNQIAEVCGKFDPKDFKSDDPLTGEYLLGYYCQWEELQKFKKGADDSDVDDEAEEEIIGEDADDEDDEESEE
ncbi:MAG: type I-C CRISPR-associated protein Cas8c/Csd1 [Anaerolineae bacterium]|nr:type I-C CRISPR-associated protein Cas8c/Csd1 [Chloroflexi bacterium CFX1]MCQ3947464.1 type I-C CRISPR-associated protein Cas8c/Csd1 [Anaerolineae bacterium]